MSVRPCQSGTSNSSAAVPGQHDVERFRSLVENSLDLVVEVSLEGEFSYISPNITTVLGYRPEELIGTSLFAHIHPEDLDQIQAQFALPEGQATCRYRHKDGSWRWLDTTGRDFFTDAGDKRGVLMARDVTARKEAEEALRRSEEQMRLILENTLDAVVTMSAEGLITGWNTQAEATFGWNRVEVAGLRMFEVLIPERDRQAHEEGLRRFLSSGQTRVMNRRLEMTALRRDGREIPIELAITPIRTAQGVSFSAFIRDLSGLKEAQEARAALEEQIRRTQKLESLGTLAGGIAHDFNNILGAIMAYTELAKMDTEGWTDVQSHLQQVLKACNRAKDLVQQILAFSRQQKTQLVPVRLQPIVEEVFQLLRSTLPKTLEMKATVRSEAGLVLADPTQIHQVLVNLCTNAAHAMRGRSGRLEVRLEPFMVDEAFASTQPELQPGRHVRLSVSDTGHGMDADTLKRIFEPFFTTKGLGEGTGLGLAVVHGIISDHEGAIQVVSRPGQGSTFHVYLPVEANNSCDAVVPSTVSLRGRKQHVLFVDDEPALCLAVEGLLRKMNYTVTSRRNPKDALNAFRAQPERFDLVITDMQMPGMTGLDLATEMLKLRPNLPVLLMTGFCDVGARERVRQLGIRDLVMKPLGPADLGETLDRVFNKQGDTSVIQRDDFRPSFFRHHP